MTKVSLFTKDGHRHDMTLSSTALRHLRTKIGVCWSGPVPQGEIVVHNEVGDTIFKAHAKDVYPMFEVHK
jgi:hypothetical protein